jgi:four helix bundle protein
MTDEVKSQESKAKSQSCGQPADLRDRLLDFAANCLKLGGRLARTTPGRYVAGQLMRSSASAGANYMEARGAESRADFIHKLQVSPKEAKESQFWLALVDRANLLPPGTSDALTGETDALVRILAKSVVTAKGRR